MVSREVVKKKRLTKLAMQSGSLGPRRKKKERAGSLKPRFEKKQGQQKKTCNAPGRSGKRFSEVSKKRSTREGKKGCEKVFFPRIFPIISQKKGRG